MSRKLASDLGCSNVLTFMLLTCSAYIKTCSARLRGFNFTLYLYSSPCFDVVLVGGWWGQRDFCKPGRDSGLGTKVLVLVLYKYGYKYNTVLARQLASRQYGSVLYKYGVLYLYKYKYSTSSSCGNVQYTCTSCVLLRW